MVDLCSAGEDVKGQNDADSHGNYFEAEVTKLKVNEDLTVQCKQK